MPVVKRVPAVWFFSNEQALDFVLWCGEVAATDGVMIFQGHNLAQRYPEKYITWVTNQ